MSASSQRATNFSAALGEIALDKSAARALPSSKHLSSKHRFLPLLLRARSSFPVSHPFPPSLSLSAIFGACTAPLRLVGSKMYKHGHMSAQRKGTLRNKSTHMHMHAQAPFFSGKQEHTRKTTDLDYVCSAAWTCIPADQRGSVHLW